MHDDNDKVEHPHPYDQRDEIGRKERAGYNNGMTIPQIRIQSSALLYNSISEQERRSWANKTGQPLLTFEEIEMYARELSQAWHEYEAVILEGMLGLYGVEFKKNIIDIYVNPWNNSISNPLIINPRRSPTIQIDTITHELLHVLFTDNTSFSIHEEDNGVRLTDEWRELFGDEHAWKSLVHIPVHAGLKSIFLDTLNEPVRLARDLSRCQHNQIYKDAWDYVESHNYSNINMQLKTLYQSLNDPSRQIK
jgi:hypothetical protein